MANNFDSGAESLSRKELRFRSDRSRNAKPIAGTGHRCLGGTLVLQNQVMSIRHDKEGVKRFRWCAHDGDIERKIAAERLCADCLFECRGSGQVSRFCRQGGKRQKRCQGEDVENSTGHTSVSGGLG